MIRGGYLGLRAQHSNRLFLVHGCLATEADRLGLVHGTGKLDALNNQLLAPVSELLVLLLERLANFEQIETLLFPDGCDRRIVTLQHLQLQLHLLHLVDDLLRLNLLLVELVLDVRHLDLLSSLGDLQTRGKVVGNALELSDFNVLLTQHGDQLLSVDVVVHFKLLDLVL